MDKDKLIQSIRSFKDKRVLVVGDVVLDKYVYGKVERVNPENPGAPLLKIERKEFRLGCAANVALNIKSLGADVCLGCVIGEDHHGKMFEELCKKNNLDLFYVKEGETIVKERSIESNFNQYLLRTDDGESALNRISEESLRKLYDLVKDLEIDAIVLSDYNKFVFRGDLGRNLVSLAINRGIPIVVDPKPANIASFKNATLLCPNINEAREIVGVGNGSEINVAKNLRDITGSKYVIVTCGKKGMISYDGSEFNEISTKVRDVVDVTGAGDTASAAMTLGLISGLSLVDSANLANYASGIVVEKQGTSTLNDKELIERIESDGNF